MNLHCQGIYQLILHKGRIPRKLYAKTVIRPYLLHAPTAVTRYNRPLVLPPDYFRPMEDAHKEAMLWRGVFWDLVLMIVCPEQVLFDFIRLCFVRNEYLK